MFISILNVSAASPVAVDDTVTINEDTTVEINVLSNDTDVDWNTLTVTSISNVTNWIELVNTDWTWVMFTPSSNFNWMWSFDYVVSDWTTSDLWHVVVTVNAMNDTPVAMDDTFTMIKNTTLTVDLVWNDLDVDWNTLTVTSLWTIANWVGTITSSWTWVMFIPSTNFVWAVSFNYVLSDGSLTDTWTVFITVTLENNDPVAVQDHITLKEDTTMTFDPRANDTDSNNDTLMIVWKTNWVYGSVSFSSTSITYKPNTDFYGSDSFTYTISDSKWWTDIWTVKVMVTKDSSEDKLVKNVQKEFIMKFKNLKDEYKDSMNDNKSRVEYLKLKNTLRNEYFEKLKDVTGKDEISNINDVKKKYIHLGDLVKLQYTYRFQIKYWQMISSLNDNQLKIVIWRIDNLITKINTWDNNYSTVAQVRLNTMLLALRELVLENITDFEWIIDIDSLYELFE